MVKQIQLSLTCLFISGCYYLQALPAIAENSIGFTSTAVLPPIALTPNTALPSTNIGTVIVKSDNASGFTISATSTNSGTLKRSSGEEIAYTLTYNGIEQGQLTLTSKVIEDVSSLITDCADANGCNRAIEVAISQPAISAKPAGSYSDQITFTLSVK